MDAQLAARISTRKSRSYFQRSCEHFFRICEHRTVLSEDSGSASSRRDVSVAQSVSEKVCESNTSERPPAICEHEAALAAQDISASSVRCQNVFRAKRAPNRVRQKMSARSLANRTQASPSSSSLDSRAQRARAANATGFPTIRDYRSVKRDLWVP